MQPLVITAAVNGSLPTKKMTPHVPTTPEEIAEVAVACRKAGASMVHVHARDEKCYPSLDPEIFTRIHRQVSERSDVIVQISTGGRADMNAQARAEPVRRIRPEMASLTTGSVNFPDQVYANSTEAVEYLAGVMREVGTKPEMEIFEADTTVPIQFLARMTHATGEDKYRDSFLRGVDYLLAAQYPNGGWPQFWPLRRGYYSHITYNDGAMIRVMTVLREVAEGEEPYDFVGAARREKAGKAVAVGIDYIIKSQVFIDGVPTVWSAQHTQSHSCRSRPAVMSTHRSAVPKAQEFCCSS